METSLKWQHKADVSNYWQWYPRLTPLPRCQPHLYVFISGYNRLFGNSEEIKCFTSFHSCSLLRVSFLKEIQQGTRYVCECHNNAMGRNCEVLALLSPAVSSSNGMSGKLFACGHQVMSEEMSQ